MVRPFRSSPRFRRALRAAAVCAAALVAAGAAVFAVSWACIDAPLEAAERYPDAIADFEAAMAAGEDEERCRYGRAVCLSQMGDSEGALKDFDWVMLNGSDEQLFAESAKLMTRLLNGEGEAAQD